MRTRQSFVMFLRPIDMRLCLVQFNLTCVHIANWVAGVERYKVHKPVPSVVITFAHVAIKSGAQQPVARRKISRTIVYWII
jgi:hypothetical protein